MPALILRDLERARYGVVKAFAVCPDAAFTWLLRELVKVLDCAGSYDDGSRVALVRLCAAIAVYLEERGQ